MKKLLQSSFIKLFTVLFLVILGISDAPAQDNSATGSCYGLNSGTYLEIDAQLQAPYYLGASERIEIEVSGGYFGDFGKHVYLIKARDGLSVSAYQENENVSGYELKIFDNGNPTNHADKYIIGINIPAGSYKSICVRARDLKTREWVNVTAQSVPTFPEVSFTTNWLYRASKSAFSLNKKMEISTDVWSSSLLTLKDTHYNPDQIYNFQIESDGLKIRQDNTINYQFRSGGNFIVNNGSVGIGTTTPPSSYKLAVAGKIISEEVNIQLQSAWPDYVFSKNYKLSSLEETEAYIEKEGHLPNIPSASEVSENGIQLGDMNAKLLEKIEELTLHQIELLKMLKAQQKEIELLKK